MTALRVGVIGAGRMGAALAFRLDLVGYEVVVAASGSAEELAPFLAQAVPDARAVDVAEAAARDVVVLALPLAAALELDPRLLAGRVVVDVMNHWSDLDPAVPGLDQLGSTSELLQRHLDSAHVVRSLHHLAAGELGEQARAAGDPGRRGVLVATDHEAAGETVAGMVDRLGYDPVRAGLSASALVAPGTAAFHAGMTAAQLRAALGDDHA